MTAQIQILLMTDITKQVMSIPRKVYKALCCCHTVQEVDERQSESDADIYRSFITA